MKCEMRDSGHKSDGTLHSATGGKSEKKIFLRFRETGKKVCKRERERGQERRGTGVETRGITFFNRIITDQRMERWTDEQMDGLSCREPLVRDQRNFKEKEEEEENEKEKRKKKKMA